ncbi:MAG: hypothetical protein CMJ49_04320 [Planctomycetaceae bacterium]|nr:hypothetical protein [Planctomycetaceae bacterium]
MSTTEQIEQAATELGRLIADHPHAKAMADAQAQLEADPEARQLITDLNRQAQVLGEKQQNQQPIEVEDKKKMEAIQNQVAANPLIGRLQVVQMDYLDLMRRANQAIDQASGDAVGGPPANGAD